MTLWDCYLWRWIYRDVERVVCCELICFYKLAIYDFCEMKAGFLEVTVTIERDIGLQSGKTLEL